MSGTIKTREELEHALHAVIDDCSLEDSDKYQVIAKLALEWGYK